MRTQLNVDNVAELCGATGSTGEYVRVLEGELVDFGGNVLEKGDAIHVADCQKNWQIPTRLRATKWETIRVYAQREFPGLVDSIDWESPVGNASINWGLCG